MITPRVEDTHVYVLSPPEEQADELPRDGWVLVVLPVTEQAAVPLTMQFGSDTYYWDRERTHHVQMSLRHNPNRVA